MALRIACLILVLLASGRRSLTAEEGATATLAPFFQSYCLECHGREDEVHGEVDLVALLDSLPPTATANTPNHESPIDTLAAIKDVLRFGQMPPEDAPQPSDKEIAEALESAQSLLQQAQRQQVTLGRVAIRRMNRFQYNNAVMDLLGLRCVVFTLPERMMREHRGYFQPETGAMPKTVSVGSRPLGKSQMIEPRLEGVAAFPQDLRAEHGYDNQADHLSLSPLLMESFLKLGQSITRSPDFNERNVGVWETLFAAPSSDDADEGAIRRRLRSLLNRAFRRPVDDATCDRYVRYTQRQLARGLSFEDAMRATVAAVLASPRFWYLYDQAGEETSVQPLDDFELASRLSFFLWGSIPDEELLELAADGRLHEEPVLKTQVERMLGDRKLKRFCDSFPSQWLQLERIISSVPDREKYPEFYFSKYRDSMHMMLEPLLVFETVLIENQSILQFIDSDFTYRSVLLREAYGETVPPEERKRGGNTTTVLRFDRLPVTDRRSGGLITNAAVMTMTSGAERTKPITRGAWLASVIFNDPPDPPPADVPPLPEQTGEGEQNLTLRERLSAHRQREDCRGCHEQIDPLGFALENYNAIGVWRDRYTNGRAVDMSGVLFRKHAFDDIAGFKDAMLAEKDRFTEAFARHLLSFALARPLRATDMESVQAIAETTAEDDYRIQTLIKQIVLSHPFRHKQHLQQNLARR